MNIGFDYIDTLGQGGNSRYSRNLLLALSEIDRHNKYYLYGYFHDWLRPHKGKTWPKNFKIKPGYFSSLGLPFPTGLVNYLNQIAVRLASKVHGLQVLHFTNPLNYVPTVAKSIVTIHDLAPFHDPKWVKKPTLTFFQTKISQVLQDSVQIIAVSHFTKQDIIEKFSLPENKITVIHEAADPVFYPDPDLELIKNDFGLEKYILYVGQLQPRKNTLRLISAYALLPAEIRDEYKLALVGQARDPEFQEQIQRTIDKAGLKNKVLLLGRVSDEKVRKLYSSTALFVYPSLFEGFGLPILEAMQCGAPIAAANTSSLPELVGKAGVLFDPTSLEAMTQAMETMIINQGIREKIQVEARIQVKQFTWQEAARKTLAIYKKYE